MKKNIHPKYQKVLFVDSATGYKFLCGSALRTEETDTFEGKQYPVCRLSVSSASHPFFTGSKALVDAEGRVDKFRKRYEAGKKPAANLEQGKEQSKENAKEPAKEKAKAKSKSK